MNTGTWRVCRRCGRRCQRGTHFDIKQSATGKPVLTYDLCQPCMLDTHPLIVPRPALGQSQAQFFIDYESFDTRAEKGATAGR